ncbi:hypothetical protein MKW94_014187 [Papaver nudicaule]|uniref:Uncharacterized protein n=1 Tax=Papaver nudicaule TaxID=74823 RepID=A0AA41VLU7_PAPNU|nr:hypothetical protein [Papaver nudicaule]
MLIWLCPLSTLMGARPRLITLLNSNQTYSLAISQTSEGNWGNNSSQTGESVSWREWKAEKTMNSENPGAASNSDAWAGWDSSDKIQSENRSSKAFDDSSAPGYWSTKSQSSQDDPSDFWGGQVEKANSAGWWSIKKQPSQDEPGNSSKMLSAAHFWVPKTGLRLAASVFLGWTGGEGRLNRWLEYQEAAFRINLVIGEGR